MIRRGRYKLITYRNPVTHAGYASGDDAVLFDLAADPGERVNLAPTGDHAAVIADLTDAIDAWDRSRRITPPTVSGKVKP